jgi:hypothetical protein
VTRTSILLDLLNRAPGLPPGAGDIAERWWRCAQTDGEGLDAFLIRHKIINEAAPLILDLVAEGTIAAAPVRLLTPMAAAVLNRRPVARPLSTVEELRSLIDDSPYPRGSAPTPPPTEFVGRVNPDGIDTIMLPPVEAPAPDGALPDPYPTPPTCLLPNSLLGRTDLADTPPTPAPLSRITPAPMPALTPAPILLVPESPGCEAQAGDTLSGSTTDRPAGDRAPPGTVHDLVLANPPRGMLGLPAIGTALGRCLLMERVGQGATGVVYRALHQTLNIPVAVKVYQRAVLAVGGEAFTQLRHDSRVLAQLNNANVVRVWDFEDDLAYPYVVLEYVEGLTLAGLIAQCGRLQPERAAAVIEQAAKGLKAVAMLGVVHRDVKPGNILLSRAGDAKVSDVGLALRPRHSAPPVACPLGTALYLAPEQGTASGPPDHRSDIYSLGATFYHALTGRPPFVGTKAADVLTRHANEAPRPPGELVPDLPPLVSEAVLTMLAKDPAQRYQTYDDLLDVLRAIRGHAPTPQPRDGLSGPCPPDQVKYRSSVWGALRSSLGFGRP